MRWLQHGPALFLSGAVGCNALFGLDSSTLVLDEGGASGAAASAVDGSTGESHSGAASGSGSGAPADLDAPVVSSGSPSSGSSGSGSSGGSSGTGRGDAEGGLEVEAGASDCTACPSGLACERYGGPTCQDPTWAQWPIANTAPDVAGGAPNPHRYTDNLDGTVTDNVTELIWQQGVPSTSYTEPDAVTYCQNISIAGHHDWRLPSEVELISIVDQGKYNPSIDETYFPGTPASPFWSSTRAGGATTLGWGVTFIFGQIGSNDISSPNYVRCVR